MWSAFKFSFTTVASSGLAAILYSTPARPLDLGTSPGFCTPCERPKVYRYPPPKRTPRPRDDFYTQHPRPRPAPHVIEDRPARRAVRPVLVLDGPGGILVPPAPIWSGLYLGGHVGYDVGTIQLSGLGSMGVDGSAIGVHFGHNWQQGRLVLGLEMDTSVSRASGGLSTNGYQLSGEAGIFSSLRGRAGLVIDNMLIYGTAGFGVAHVEAGNGTSQGSATLPAFVLGAGIEWKHSAPVSLRLEALYWELGERNVDFGLGNRALDGAFGTLRAGLTFHFN